MDVVSLRNNIKVLMGADVVRLEIPDTTIDKLIGMAYNLIKPYASGVKRITKPASNKIDLREDKVIEVVRVLPGTTLYSGMNEVLFDFQLYNNKLKMDPLTMVERSASPDFSIAFEFDSGYLYLGQGSILSAVTIEALVDLSIEELNDERAVAWIQKYATALVKETVGRIRSKYKSSNLPLDMDGDTLLSEASNDKQTLESELVERDFGPAFVLR